jgi:hypothetical protein
MSSGFKWFYVRSYKFLPRLIETVGIETVEAKPVPVPAEQNVGPTGTEVGLSRQALTVSSSVANGAGIEALTSHTAIGTDRFVNQALFEVMKGEEIPVPTRFVNQILLEEMPSIPRDAENYGVGRTFIEVMPSKDFDAIVSRVEGAKLETFRAPVSPNLYVRADVAKLETIRSPISPNLYVRADQTKTETLRSPITEHLYVRSDVSKVESAASKHESTYPLSVDNIGIENNLITIHDDDIYHVEQIQNETALIQSASQVVLDRSVDVVSNEVSLLTESIAYPRHVEGLHVDQYLSPIETASAIIRTVDKTVIEETLSEDADERKYHTEHARVELGVSTTSSVMNSFVDFVTSPESIVSSESLAARRFVDFVRDESIIVGEVIDLNRVVDCITPEIFLNQFFFNPPSGSYLFLRSLLPEIAFQESSTAAMAYLAQLLSEVSYEENLLFTKAYLSQLLVEAAFNNEVNASNNFFGRALLGNVTYTTNTNVGDGTVDGDYVVVEYGNLTINSGVTLSTSVRKRGLIIYVSGSCVISGSISMTARGASGTLTGGFQMHKNTSGSVIPYNTFASNSTLTIEQTNQLTGSLTAYNIPQTGAAGGSGNVAGTAGTNGSGGGGGGGSGGNFGGPGRSGGSGAAGGCFGGGAGGGGAGRDSNGGNAVANSGQGGNGGGTGGFTFSGGGGAGNPGGSAVGGTGYRTGDGVGGVIYLIVGGNLTIRSGATITANGVNGGNPYAGNGSAGGGSGGGSITILYGGSLSNSGTVQANGGLGGISADAAPNGAPGGAGSIRIFKVLANP